jgi:hypothetical protein
LKKDKQGEQNLLQQFPHLPHDLSGWQNNIYIILAGMPKNALTKDPAAILPQFLQKHLRKLSSSSLLSIQYQFDEFPEIINTTILV